MENEILYDELIHYKQFVVWKYQKRQGGKDTKPPFNPANGAHAKVNDPSTWGTYQQAFEAKRAGGYAGIGFVLTENDPFTVIDLDDPAEDTHMSFEQSEIIKQAKSYTELSPSEAGYHIWLKGKVQSGIRKGKIEMYSTGRYITLTFDAINDYPVKEKQEFIDILWDRLGGMSEDKQLISMASSAQNGEKFNKLWKGEWQNDYKSQSEADYALLSIIHFYTNDDDKTIRIFLKSALGQRDKAHRSDYLRRALQSLASPKVDLTQFKAEINTKKVEQEVKEAYKQPFDNLLFRVADFIYEASPLQVREISLAAAIGLLSGMCSKAYNVSLTGLNLYLLLLAGTGTGKEAMRSGIDRIVEQVPEIDTFVGPSSFASGPAISRYLAKKENNTGKVAIFGEFGSRLKQMTDNRIASGAEESLKAQLLDIFGASGKSTKARGRIYSKEADSTGSVRAPALTILGESTPETFIEALTDNAVAGGFIPRFIILNYTGKRPYLNQKHGDARLSTQDVEHLTALATNILTVVANGTPIEVKSSIEGAKEYTKTDVIITDFHNESTVLLRTQMYTRASLNIFKLASLLAVCDNMYEPILTKEHIIWARNFVMTSIEYTLSKLLDVEVAGSIESKQIATVTRVINEYFKDTPVKLNVKSEIFNAKLITYAYLLRRTSVLSVFKQDRNGSTAALKRTLQSMVDTGTLLEMPVQQVQQRFNTTQRLFAVVGD